MVGTLVLSSTGDLFLLWRAASRVGVETGLMQVTATPIASAILRDPSLKVYPKCGPYLLLNVMTLCLLRLSRLSYLSL